jgi:hypothetical protein
VAVTGAPSGFELRARSPVPVVSAFPLQVLQRHGDRLRAAVAPSGAARGAAAGDGRSRPLVELRSVLGRVVLEAALAGPGSGPGQAPGLR